MSWAVFGIEITAPLKVYVKGDKMSELWEVVRTFRDCLRREVLTVAVMNLVPEMMPSSAVNSPRKPLVMVDC